MSGRNATLQRRGRPGLGQTRAQEMRAIMKEAEAALMQAGRSMQGRYNLSEPTIRHIVNEALEEQVWETLADTPRDRWDQEVRGRFLDRANKVFLNRLQALDRSATDSLEDILDIEIGRAEEKIREIRETQQPAGGSGQQPSGGPATPPDSGGSGQQRAGDDEQTTQPSRPDTQQAGIGAGTWALLGGATALGIWWKPIKRFLGIGSSSPRENPSGSDTKVYERSKKHYPTKRRAWRSIGNKTDHEPEDVVENWDTSDKWKFRIEV